MKGKGSLVVLAAFVLGVGASATLPALDEYAALGRIGEVRYVGEHESLDLPPNWPMGTDDPRYRDGRLRIWSVKAPKASVQSTLAHLLDPRFGWRSGTPFGGPFVAPGKPARGKDTLYINQETSDVVEVVETPRAAGGEDMEVRVTEAPGSRGGWARARRWARRTFAR